MAAPARRHPWRHGADHEQHREHIGQRGGVDVLARGLQQRLAHGAIDAGIVDQNVDLEVGKRRVKRVRVAKVDGQGLAPGLGGQGVQPVGAPREGDGFDAARARTASRRRQSRSTRPSQARGGSPIAQ